MRFPYPTMASSPVVVRGNVQDAAATGHYPTPPGHRRVVREFSAGDTPESLPPLFEALDTCAEDRHSNCAIFDGSI